MGKAKKTTPADDGEVAGEPRDAEIDKLKDERDAAVQALAVKDDEIAKLTAERDAHYERIGVLEAAVQATAGKDDEIAKLTAENAELRAAIVEQTKSVGSVVGVIGVAPPASIDDLPKLDALPVHKPLD